MYKIKRGTFSVSETININKSQFSRTCNGQCRRMAAFLCHFVMEFLWSSQKEINFISLIYFQVSSRSISLPTMTDKLIMENCCFCNAIYEDITSFRIQVWSTVTLTTLKYSFRKILLNCVTFLCTKNIRTVQNIVSLLVVMLILFWS